jgi:hypothetical protein
VEVLAMTRAVLAAAGVSTLLALGAPAEAAADVGFRIVIGHGPSHGYGHGYARPRYYDHGDYAYRAGYDRGYEKGFDHGRDDAEDRDGFNFWHSKDYRNADKGYRGHYGPRWDYQRGFRAGYEHGYRRAYDHFEHRHDHGRCDRGGYYTRELPRYRYDRYR